MKADFLLAFLSIEVENMWMYLQPANDDVYELYWYFAYERFMILKRRLAGQPAPWTDDPILQTFKFCNTFRSMDYVSQDLLREIALQPDNPSDDVFRTLLYRFFSKPETYRHICQKLSRAPRIDDLRSSRIDDILDERKANGNTLYTNAFILASSRSLGVELKHRMQLEVLRQMFLRDEMDQQVLSLRAMEELCNILQLYPLIGPFMAYQFAQDVCYLPWVAIDPNTYTIAGPGAIRGIHKIYPGAQKDSFSKIIIHMYTTQQSEFKRLGYDFYQQTGGMTLSLGDCQGLFCELDKYCRVARPDLLSNRKKVKTTFEPSHTILQIVTPPKECL
jgi:hypothetical protein